MSIPRVPIEWTFQPKVRVLRHDDGTFSVHMDWYDSYLFAYDAQGNDLTDVREVGSKFMDAFLGTTGYEYDVVTHYLPEGWVEPETAEEVELREALEELRRMSADLA